jgi:hypothetical protein
MLRKLRDNHSELVDVHCGKARAITLWKARSRTLALKFTPSRLSGAA